MTLSSKPPITGSFCLAPSSKYVYVSLYIPHELDAVSNQICMYLCT